MCTKLSSPADTPMFVAVSEKQKLVLKEENIDEVIHKSLYYSTFMRVLSGIDNKIKRILVKQLNLVKYRHTVCMLYIFKV